MDGDTVKHCVDALCMCAVVVACVIVAGRS